MHFANISSSIDNSCQCMDLHAFLLVLFLSSILLCHGGIEGDSDHWELSEKEDLELEKQLKFLNKPAIQTIQMKPTSLLRTSSRDQVSSKFAKPASITLKGGGCPVGTVPIRRITKEDLIREKIASKIKSVEYSTLGDHFAVVRIRANSNKKFVGAGGKISIHNPRVDGRSYSAARVSVRNGPDTIAAGWRVDPTLYGDTRTRLYIRLDAGKSHCFNTRCPGFVIVRSDIPLDQAYNTISVPGGQFFVLEAYIIKDQPNGNWWVELGPSRTQVGFWPKQIFSGLQDLATYIEWGGKTYSPSGTTPPQMGSGMFAVKNNLGNGDAYISQVSVLNEFRQIVDPDNAEEFADNNWLYNVRDEGNKGGNVQRLVLYGGPGGKRRV
ncbi:hypothetical protein RHSIM_Rhsim02G0167100 [Rhododendron simsii]|uniref:Neprosin PEP catalytic domain-containing protein n=1 Tax=Rhododendron simsii TaxID=118357 RepID=A0A834HGC9_RHOSS|nr:hypothetical protein RHSIM_Rhsim02G0167100 [Rhododendron simsii]